MALYDIRVSGAGVTAVGVGYGGGECGAQGAKEGLEGQIGGFVEGERAV